MTVPSNQVPDRDTTVARALRWFDEGGLLDLLRPRVARKTESQRADSRADLIGYLTDDIAPSLAVLGFKWRLVDNPSGAAPFLFAERHEVGIVHPRLVAILLLETLRDRARLAPRLGERDAIAQTRDYPKVVASPVWRWPGELAREPEIDANGDVDRRRHDADDAEGLVVEIDHRA